MVSLNTLLVLIIVIHTGMMFMDGIVTTWEFIGSALFAFMVFYTMLVIETWPPETEAI